MRHYQNIVVGAPIHYAVEIKAGMADAEMICRCELRLFHNSAIQLLVE